MAVPSTPAADATPAPAAAPAGPDPLVRATQASILVYLAGTLAAVVVAAVYWDAAARPALIGWLAVFCTLTVVRLGTATAFLVKRPPPSAHGAWARSGVAMALVQAALWGALGFVLFEGSGSAEQEAVLHVVLCAVAMGAAVHLAPVARVLQVYVSLVLAPLVVRDVLIGDAFHLTLALLGLLIGLYTLVIARHQARALAEILAQRQHNAALVAALHRENERREQARQAAENANAARTRFFAAANHDLRQPLNAIGLLTQSLHHVRRAEDVGEVADHLAACVDGMTGVVDELLEITRLDAGSLEPDRAAFRLDLLVRDCCRQFEIAARVKGLAMTVDVPAVGVLSDREMLSRILGNLVSNAVRYTPAGQVVVRARVGEEVVVEVEDTGIGIAPEHQARIFDEFFQVANPGRDRRLGLGLGLSTVRRLCDLLGHRVEVQSAAGAGSRFTLRLGPPQDALRPGTTPVATPVLPLAANRRVLVIEDDHDARTALARLLASWGSEVATAPGLATALAVLQSGFRPDALIVDLRLADGASGIEAIEQVRQACDAALPTVLVTGDANAEALTDPRLAGVPVLFKPIRAARLRAFLAQAFAA